MIKHIAYCLALTVIMVVSGCATAQNYPKRSVDGKEYYVYFVEPGNTVYAVSRMFSVEPEVVLKANPGAADGLQVGQEILIPVARIDKRQARRSNLSLSGQYILHEVGKKETMFSISRQYGVDLATLMELNPVQAERLHTGDTLRIPATRSTSVEETLLQPAENDSFMVHQVQKGETVYSLSKQYGIPQDSLSRANAGFPEGLQTGRYIVIPKYKESYLAAVEADIRRKVDSTLKLPTETPETYNMAMMLPFELEYNDSLDRSLASGNQLYILTEVALEYYRGSMLALDSLKKMGLNANVYVYDVGDDLVKARDVTRRPEMSDMHLVFGPMHKSSLGVVSEVSRDRQMYLVSPNSFSSKVFEDNPYLLRAQASDQTLMRYLANYVAIQHGDDNVWMVNSTLAEDWPERRDFKKYYNEAVGNYPNAFSDSLRSFTKDALTDGSIAERLKKDVPNILVVPSDDLAFVSSFLTQLSRLSETEYDIRVYGMENWLEYDNIEAAYKNRFHLRLAVPSFVDYEDEQVNAFLRAYRERYNTDPSYFDYGFMGYDLMMFFGQALLKGGLRFPAYFDQLETDGVMGHYRFGKSMSGQEYENKAVYIIEYDDYELRRVN